MIKSFQSKQKVYFIKKQIKQMDLTSIDWSCLSGGDQRFGFAGGLKILGRKKHSAK
jgi:hypothetical protein